MTIYDQGAPCMQYQRQKIFLCHRHCNFYTFPRLNKHYLFTVSKTFLQSNIRTTTSIRQRQTYSEEVNLEDDEVKTHRHHDSSYQPQIPPWTHDSQRLILRYAAISHNKIIYCPKPPKINKLMILLFNKCDKNW